MVGLGVLISGVPCPSTELGLADQSKEWAAGVLKWSRLREAGFTEQQTVSALYSGRITRRCLPSPVTLDGLLQLNHNFFFPSTEKSFMF
ncbi:hypothetical protein R3W88_025671 [Solanum pinnatisectum]|uniref:Uncharacterized protein n=1 Tax=Solanum pinnatisectum TaxID=50273 RepID=A0AAV9M3Q3_9SOLN|nr:hypothetical protein R3W88_025671 [Solanum pinnatisectum]